jgi:hypothetical protein
MSSIKFFIFFNLYFVWSIKTKTYFCLTVQSIKKKMRKTKGRKVFKTK